MPPSGENRLSSLQPSCDVARRHAGQRHGVEVACVGEQHPVPVDVREAQQAAFLLLGLLGLGLLSLLTLLTLLGLLLGLWLAAGGQHHGK
jgi:hypothetical protein